MPQISIIVPVYNVEPYLCRCVNSILAQTFTDFELILVDDGSPDNCGAICDEYAAKDSRIRVIHQENGGLSAARNAGIDWAFANSDSEWISFIDSDDWVHPEYLRVLHGANAERHTEIGICGFERTEGETPVVGADLEKSATVWDPETFFVERNANAVVACGKLYKKSLFSGIRYPQGKINEDRFVTHRLLFPLTAVAFVPSPLYYYFQRDDSIMHLPWTPQRMDDIQGCAAQMAFFKKEGYSRAYDLSRVKYAHLVSNAIPHLESRTKEKTYWIRELRRTLREARLPFGDNIWIYYEAYPALTAVFLACRGIIRRIGDLFRKRR